MTGGRNEEPLILVVDDDPDFRTMVVATLRVAGYRVTAAESVTEALAVAQGSAPDFVLLDIQLSGTEGLNLVRIIRSTMPAPLRDVHVCALSGLERSVWRARALNAGCHEFIEKPISPGELIEVVRRHTT